MVSLPHARFGVIDDARRRQRRRRLGWSAVFISALAAFAFVRDEPTGDRPASPPRVARFVAPSKVLAREPYMGVACSVPNSTRCDRFGLGVWVKRPAVAVTAEIRGRKFPLGDRYWITTQHGHRRLEFD